jgi:iron complex transport system substrate-binding protein
MRIASLLPSATEIVYAIGLGDDLVAVTHECDWPPAVVGTPVVTRAELVDGATGAREIHDRVTDASHGGSSIYALDADALAEAAPDLILTQELCQVCAVSYRQVDEVVRRMDTGTTVISLEPTTVEGILNSISTVGAMTEAEDAAMTLVEALRERLRAVELRVDARRQAGHRAPRVVGLEWLDPPFTVGHWVPEQIRRAGGWDLLGVAGGPARETTWDAVIDVAPQMLFLMPCGRNLSQTQAEWRDVTIPAEMAEIPAALGGSIIALDGSAYFSRPGPRVIDGIELLAEVMDPDGFRDIAPVDGWAPVELS